MMGDEGETCRTFRAGIDVGGTFTDLVAYDEDAGVLISIKVHTTRDDPSEGVFQSFQQFKGLFPETLETRELVHATTIATNILLEKKGAKTCLLTTKGFEDVLELRRHNRPQMYDLFQEISPPLVPRHLRIGITERLDGGGAVLIPIEKRELLDAIQAMQSQGVTSVAICFLHAYANPLHERMAREEIAKHLPYLFISCSHEVWPEFREYERTSTTVLNAYIMPSSDYHLKNMSKVLSKESVAAFSVMQSNGGLTSVENARRFPVHLIESGPAAGIVSAAWFGKCLGIENIIALDIGGTTAKAGMITKGNPHITTEFHADSLRHGIPVGGYPIKSPVIDLVEISAGGGSIAWIDKAGILKVGPNSAGAVPGPACYGFGGIEPTVTDANLILGYLNPEYFHGGQTRLYPEPAEKALNDRIGKFFNWSIEKSAASIIRIAKANLIEMVRLISIQKGFDPRDFSLLAYGGAGPLHANFIAKHLNIGKTIIPPLAGVFSAMGLLVAGVRHDLARTHPYLADEMPADAGPEIFNDLKEQMMTRLQREDRDLTRVKILRSVDVRYLGQVFELTIPVEIDLGRPEEIQTLERRFEEKYKATFHYTLPGSRIEIVNFRCTAVIEDETSRIDMFSHKPPESTERSQHSVRRIFDEQQGKFIEVPSYRREWLSAGEQIGGPAIIDAQDTTIFILEDQRGFVDERGCLIIKSE